MAEVSRRVDGEQPPSASHLFDRHDQEQRNLKEAEDRIATASTCASTGPGAEQDPTEPNDSLDGFITSDGEEYGASDESDGGEEEASDRRTSNQWTASRRSQSPGGQRRPRIVSSSSSSSSGDENDGEDANPPHSAPNAAALPQTERSTEALPFPPPYATTSDLMALRRQAYRATSSAGRAEGREARQGDEAEVTRPYLIDEDGALAGGAEPTEAHPPLAQPDQRRRRQEQRARKREHDAKGIKKRWSKDGRPLLRFRVDGMAEEPRNARIIFEAKVSQVLESMHWGGPLTSLLTHDDGPRGA